MGNRAGFGVKLFGGGGGGGGGGGVKIVGRGSMYYERQSSQYDGTIALAFHCQ